MATNYRAPALTHDWVTMSSREARSNLSRITQSPSSTGRTQLVTIALSLVAILALSVVFQYASTMILIYTGKLDAIPNLDKTFNILMPLLAGLVGGATPITLRRKNDDHR